MGLLVPELFKGISADIMSNHILFGKYVHNICMLGLDRNKYMWSLTVYA